jgi:hypothetical protein
MKKQNVNKRIDGSLLNVIYYFIHLFWTCFYLGNIWIRSGIVFSFIYIYDDLAATVFVYIGYRGKK